MAARTVQAGGITTQVSIAESSAVFVMAFKTKTRDGGFQESFPFPTMGQMAIQTGVFGRRMNGCCHLIIHLIIVAKNTNHG